MTVRWVAGLAGTSFLLLLPLIIAQAQTSEIPPAEKTSAAEIRTDRDREAVRTEEESITEAPSEGEVLGATTGGGVTSTEPTSGTTTDSATLEIELASSTASSTEPVSKPKPKPVPEPRTVYLQASAKIDSHFKVGAVTATITLQNLTCRDCGSSSPPVAVKAYYMPWQDNDGTELSTTTERMMEQTISLDSIAPWQSSTTKWEAEIITPGHYSFVIQVDPDNSIGARDTYRTEFFVD